MVNQLNSIEVFGNRHFCSDNFSVNAIIGLSENLILDSDGRIEGHKFMTG